MDVNTEDFGKIDYLEFHSYVKDIKSSNSTYNTLTTVKKLLIEATKSGYTFEISPKLFSVPQKPNSKHFPPLPNEKLSALKTFLKTEINKIYEREKTFQNALTYGSSITKTGDCFKKTENHKPVESFWKWKINLNDCLYQLYKENPQYPNNTTIEQCQSGGEYAIIKKVDYDLLNTPFKLLYKRFGIQRLTNSTPLLSDAPDYNYIDAIGVIYPRIFEIYIILWAICLETGWSQDMVERINYDDYLFSPIPIESDFAFIKTIKVKGQQGGEFNSCKEFVHPSSKTSSFSAYNLIKLLVNRTSRLRSGLNYEKEVEDVGSEPLFIYFNESPGQRILSRHPDRTSDKGIDTKNRFMENHLGFKFDVRQLRPTCLYQREKEQDLPLLLQVALFGHSSSAITDEFYKDSAPFRQLRKDKLGIELNAIHDSINDGTFKGTLVPLKQNKNIKDKIITIFTDHSGQSPIAICKNNQKPDWPGFIEEMLINGVCKNFNKCLLCSQSQVFSDNIPFVVDRFMYLDQMKRKSRNDVFESSYSDEYLAAEEVIQNWPNKEDIEEAEERTMLEDFLLPPIISESF